MIEIEDLHEDILAKAMRGLEIGKIEMASRLGLNKAKIESILSGEVDEKIIRSMAEVLKLNKEKLIISAHKKWRPPCIEISQLEQFNLPFGQMFVNIYVIWDKDSQKAWIFDAGPSVGPILNLMKEKNLQIDAIFLTHTHNDHIASLNELKEKTGAPPVYVHKNEIIEGTIGIEENYKIKMGSLSLESIHTHGHSTGGMTYLIDGLEKPIAVVGDAIFAGSMGGGLVSYSNALKTNNEKIMSLSGNFVICPGHGPLSTIREEKMHNPFFNF